MCRRLTSISPTFLTILYINTTRAELHLLTAGEIDFLVMLMFLLIASRIYGPILTVLTLLPDILYLKISTKRLRALMESEAMTGETSTPIENTDISFDNVSFAYGEEPVLDGVDFTAKTGEITALVGPSGSGKSTISKLAARFWDTDGGTVSVGGVDVKALDPEYLMQHFAFVFQEVILFLSLRSHIYCKATALNFGTGELLYSQDLAK